MGVKSKQQDAEMYMRKVMRVTMRDRIRDADIRTEFRIQSTLELIKKDS